MLWVRGRGAGEREERQLPRTGSVRKVRSVSGRAGKAGRAEGARGTNCSTKYFTKLKIQKSEQLLDLIFDKIFDHNFRHFCCANTLGVISQSEKPYVWSIFLWHRSRR